jgi:NADPH2:quinone reductase
VGAAARSYGRPVRAVRCVAHGPVADLSDLLRVEELPDPVPGAGEVVVDVGAAAVNFTDLLFVADAYQVSIPTPYTPGSEFAGTVTAVGAEVDGVAVGDRVMGRSWTGAFAEKVLVAAADVSPVPAALPTADAAAVGLVYSTAYSALRTAAEVAPGEWVAITGAAGGVGSAAVALTGRMGARSLAVVSSAAKAAFCREIGADAVVDLSAGGGPAGLRDAAREATDGGVDVVLDVVGGGLAEPLLRALRPHGRFVTIGFASGEIPRIPLNLVLLKRIVVRGFEVREFPRYEPEEARRDAGELAELLAAGVDGHVRARFPLDGVVAALTSVSDRTAVGKVVLEPGG